MSGPYGKPDTTGTDPYDYDSDGLPFDAPAGYEPGDYWLRERMLNAESAAAVEAVWAWEPDAIDTGRVMQRLRVILAARAEAATFDRWRIREATMREGFGYEEGVRLEKALVDGGHIVLVSFDLEENGDVIVPTYALTRLGGEGTGVQHG